MLTLRRTILMTVVLLVAAMPAAADDEPLPPGFDQIETIVVVYSENRGFVHLLPDQPGTSGIAAAPASAVAQRDRDGTPLPQLPPVWIKESAADGSEGEAYVPNPAYPASMPNEPFRIDAPPYDKPADVLTVIPVHRFYQNQMQINGGLNDMFIAWTDTGSLSMGHYASEGTHLAALATEFTVADQFFQGAFGGSNLNHFYLACACSPVFEDAPQSMRAVVEDDGVTLKLAADSPASALDGPPKWVQDGSISPDSHVVNTVQPPYQPSAIPPPTPGDQRLADPSQNPLPAQDLPTLGDRLSDKDVDWGWYAQGWNTALAYRGVIYNTNGAVNFQPHHQPYNYFKNYAPGTQAREEHLKDMEEFWDEAAAGTLPPVVFVKPDGTWNQHPGESTMAAGDLMVGTIVDTLRESPQWESMAIIITHDENGGFWDPAPPPKADRWGPGTRVPTVIASPFAKKGFVDHTVYDTTSILAFISKRFDMEMLPGVRTQFGDLRNAFDIAGDD